MSKNDQPLVMQLKGSIKCLEHVMSTHNTEQQHETGCLPLLRACLMVSWGLFILFLVLHPPIDYVKLISSALLLLLCLLSFHARFEFLLRRFPLLTILPLLIVGFAMLYPVVTHSPLDYFQLFLALVPVCLLLFVFSPWFKRVALRPWFESVLQ